jgi:hypothetical protein
MVLDVVPGIPTWAAHLEHILEDRLSLETGSAGLE